MDGSARVRIHHIQDRRKFVVVANVSYNYDVARVYLYWGKIYRVSDEEAPALEMGEK